MSLTLWRLSKRKHAATAFSGEGSRLVAGRWHSKGSRIVYTSATLSLAALELFVHMEIEDAGETFVSIQADVPQEVAIDELDLTRLLKDWNTIPAPLSLRGIGDDWVASGSAAVLRVPSAVISSEWNYLINPLHEDFQQIQIYNLSPFVLDPRMWKSW